MEKMHVINLTYNKDDYLANNISSERLEGTSLNMIFFSYFELLLLLSDKM